MNYKRECNRTLKSCNNRKIDKKYRQEYHSNATQEIVHKNCRYFYAQTYDDEIANDDDDPILTTRNVDRLANWIKRSHYFEYGNNNSSIELSHLAIELAVFRLRTIHSIENELCIFHHDKIGTTLSSEWASASKPLRRVDSIKIPDDLRTYKIRQSNVTQWYMRILSLLTSTYFCITCKIDSWMKYARRARAQTGSTQNEFSYAPFSRHIETLTRFFRLHTDAISINTYVSRLTYRVKLGLPAFIRRRKSFRVNLRGCFTMVHACYIINKKR